jgi:hypothetical protein
MMPDPSLETVDKQQMNILGLMIGGIIETNLRRPEMASLARELKGNVGVTAGKMSVTLSFEDGVVTLTRGLRKRLRASARGTLDGLLQISLGKGAIRSFLAGDLSFSGNPFFMLRILPLIRVEQKVKKP